MKITDTSIDGLKILEPETFGDARGYYSPRFVDNEMRELGFAGVKQISRSSSRRGILRGLHYQEGEFAQAKIAEVIRGRAIDIAVDIRPESKTFGKAEILELAPIGSMHGGKMFYIPRGFAHGYLAIDEGTVFQYYIDNDWNPKAERGINWKSVDIDWNALFFKYHISKPELNNRDENYPMLNDIFIK